MTNPIKFVVDKRTEIVSIILAFSKCNEYAEEHFNLSIEEPYRNDILEYFSKFRHHKAIKLAKQLGVIEKGFNYDNPIVLSLNLEQNLSFKGKLSARILSELGNEDLQKEFLYAVKDFADESKFDHFYKNHNKYYQTKLNELSEYCDKNTGIFLSKYFKEKPTNKFVVNLIPTLVNSNHGIKINNQMWANIGLLSEDYKSIVRFNDGYTHIILHEFIHSFVNGNTEKHLQNFNLNISDKHTKKIKHYENKISYINDTIVRGLTIRLREQLNGINSENFFAIEKQQGFTLIEKVYDAVLKYEKQDLSWNDYFPNILEIFLNEKEQTISKS